MNRLIATVAVENTFFSGASDYDYYIPDNLKDDITLGSLVRVPFGRGNVIRKGIVVSIYSAMNSELKEIVGVDKKQQPLSKEMVELSLWMKERYFCTTYDCLKQMLPRGLGKIGDKNTKMVRLCENEASVKKLTPKQQTVLNLLYDVGAAQLNEICEFCSVGKSVVDNLIKYGVCEYYEKEIYRNPYSNITSNCKKEEIILSNAQQKAFDTYNAMLHSKGGTGLLFGVTGSGKTQVYLRLIDEAVAMDRDVIVLVPEISLTPQMLSIFHKRYGKQVAVFHSGLSLGERNDEYKRALRGDAKIVIGTRSAVFAPLQNIGLIIMDEEQEHTYKSERTPRYQTREIAKFRSKYNKALFLMTSATPSVESYSAALSGKYTLCEMTERYGDSKLPKVITVDMKQEIKNGNKSPISETLRDMIKENLERKKQTILLINRRGYNTFIACNSCGHVITCPNCSISLTYHSYNNLLMCHYCGFAKPLDNICPECGQNSIRYSGYGTQRIEDELSRLFPEARVLRMDADTTSKKFSHQKLFDSFSNGEYDILIGTQMVAKGLDFPNVTLVGVVNADNSLYDENYTAQEKSFDLITQVVGRSGRRNENGYAVIQTINPYNEVIKYASKQDYHSFYENEIALRKVLTYPPFCDIYSVSFISEDENNAALCAKAFFEFLVKLNKEEYSSEKIIVLGPSAAKISKLNNEYRYRLAVKCKNSKIVRKMLNDILNRLSKIKEYSGVSVSVDLNPTELN
uniref:replication restart helicase PriA n=1 Tax=Eubacterium sp. TaxID=142586 RepID=UPI00402A379A